MNLTIGMTGLVRLLEWTWRTSFEVSVLILLVAVVQRLSRRWLTAQGRFILSSLVVLRLLTPIVPVSSMSVFGWRWWRPEPEAMSTSPRLVALASAPAAPEVRIEPSVQFTNAPKSAPVKLESVLAALWLAGVMTNLLLVARQQARFSRWLRTHPPAMDEPLLGLLESCKRSLSVSRVVELVIVEDGTGPALFGWRQPKLVLPRKSIEILTPGELRLVLLHELAHVRNHDVLLNWVLIGLHSWHWFNLLVGWALRRLRADRELVCDAVVLRNLGVAEQRLYGQVLLKLLAQAGQRQFSPHALSVINSKSEIKDRITMITLFKPHTRTASVLTAALAGLLCCLTFTHAADPAKKAAPHLASPPETDQAAEQTRGRSAVQVLEQKLHEQEEKVRFCQVRVDALRHELGSIDSSASASGSESVDQETIKTLTRDLATARSRKAGLEALNDQWRNRDIKELRQMLPTAVPDNLLNGLLERLSIAETESARLSVEHGPEFPGVRSVAAAIANLNKQIDTRVAGILTGLRTQMASAAATESSLGRSIDVAKTRDAEMMEHYRPYFEAKRELETQQRIRETLNLRLMQEQVDRDLSPGPK